MNTMIKSLQFCDSCGKQMDTPGIHIQPGSQFTYIGVGNRSCKVMRLDFCSHECLSKWFMELPTESCS